MKKILLLAGLLFAGLAQAQIIAVTTYGNAPITDGQVFTYDQLYNMNSPHVANLPLFIQNVSDQPIRLKLRMDSMENADGNTNPDLGGISFCFWQSCYFSAVEGSTVPASGAGMPLAPGETTTTDNHFRNSYAGDTAGQPVVYNMSIVQVNDAGAIIGEPLISFTYQYVPTMGIDALTSLSNMGLALENTVVKNNINIKADQAATMEVYDLTGKLLKMAAIKEGSQSIDLSGLSAAVYIAKFTTTGNQSSSTRIVKQ